MTKEEILKEFDEKFSIIANKGVQCDKITLENIKSFISNALDQHAKAERERVVEKMLETIQRYFPELKSVGDEIAVLSMYKEIQSLADTSVGGK